jgi:hypothetical protein
MSCFERTFQIPSHHFLEQVRTRSRGGVVMEVHWEHREYAANGGFVARYESYQTLDSNDRIPRNGWSKYDHDGHLVDQGHFIVSGNSTNLLDEA